MSASAQAKDWTMELTPEERAEFEESFQYNDLDNDGKITLEEFVKMLGGLEADVDAHEARIGFHAIDTDRDGAIELDEFIDWWRER